MLGFLYKTKLILRIHIESKHKMKNYSCEACNLHFAAKSGLWTHKKRIHEGRTFHCELCSYKTVGKDHLQKHISLKHEPLNGKSLIKCDYCLYEAITSKSIKLHTETHHMERTKLVCKICSKGLSNRKSLQYHTRLHTKPDKELK